jgi:hypothetical protein
MFHDYFHLHQFNNDQNRLARELELKRSIEENGRQVVHRNRFRVVAWALGRRVARRDHTVALDGQPSVAGDTVLSQ